MSNILNSNLNNFVSVLKILYFYDICVYLLLFNVNIYYNRRMILINNLSGEDYIEVKLLMSINSIVDILYYSTPIRIFIYIVFLYV